MKKFAFLSVLMASPLMSINISLTTEELAQYLVENPEKAFAYLFGLDNEHAGDEFFKAITSEHFSPAEISTFGPQDHPSSLLFIPPESSDEFYFYEKAQENIVNKSIKIDYNINYLKYIILSLNSGNFNVCFMLASMFNNEDAKKSIKKLLYFFDIIKTAFSDKIDNAPYPKMTGLRAEHYLKSLKSYQLLKYLDAKPVTIGRVNNFFSFNTNEYDMDFQMFVHLILLDNNVSTHFQDNFLSYYKNETTFKDAFDKFVSHIDQLSTNKLGEIFGLGSKLSEKLLFIKDMHKKPLSNAQNVRREIMSIPPFTNIIFNNDGFESENLVKETQHVIKGNSIEKDGVKTGYNIHFPQELNETSAIIVHVYGGYGLAEKKGDFIPGFLNQMQQYLLNKKMVIITLNLPDRLKLKTHFKDMDESLHEEIHQAINNFYEAIKFDTERFTNNINIDRSMRERVSKLKDLPIFIEGNCFGGAIAVRHIQIFPDTFIGAISHRGPLSPFIETNSKNPHWPIKYIDNLHDRVLIINNIEDTIIPISSAILFYKEATMKNKNVSLHLMLDSDPDYLKKLGLMNLIQRGHGFPVGKQSFDTCLSKIKNFINGAPMDEDMEQQDYLRTMLDNETGMIKGTHLKNQYSPIWYLLKETIFSNSPNKSEIRSIVNRLAPKRAPHVGAQCSIQ